MYYAYILQLANGSYYHGFSTNLENRIKEHCQEFVSHTKNLRPVELVFYAAFETKKKAFDFEKYLKTNSGFVFRN